MQIRGCVLVAYVLTYRIKIGWLQRTVGKKIVMGKPLGLLLGALTIGVIIGVVFQLAYTTLEIGPELGVLFALLGLVLSLLVRAGWHAFLGRGE
jgi:hypothetical protein